jgi:D-proline reductase (dithiol) PrdB
MSEAENNFGFAKEFDRPIPYLHRITSYYQTLGYGKPYRWAQYNDVPFTHLKKPLSESRVALVTTAAPYQPDKGDQGPGAPYNSAAKFYTVYTDKTETEPDLRVSHIGIDRNHTTAEDMRTWFPLKQLKRLVDEGLVGGVTERFYGAPTNRSQQRTIEVDCPEIFERIREDGGDVAVIVAN